MSSLVRLEDSRLLEDWKSMEQVQSNIMNADSDLMLKQRVRHANRDNLTKVLKKLNSYIDSGSKLRSENKNSSIISILARIGKEPVKILNVCRQAEESKFRYFYKVHQLIKNEKLALSFLNTEKSTSKKFGRLSKSSWRLTLSNASST